MNFSKTGTIFRSLLTSTVPCVTHQILVQFSSVAQLCPTLCNPMDCSMPGLPVHHQSPEFTQTHDHRVSDATQPSHLLPSPSPPALNLSQQMSQLFVWGGQSIGVSASRSVLPVNTQDWSPLGWTGWISLLAWDNRPLSSFPCSCAVMLTLPLCGSKLQNYFWLSISSARMNAHQMSTVIFLGVKLQGAFTYQVVYFSTIWMIAYFSRGLQNSSRKIHNIYKQILGY